jgi:hypothetical protein
VLPTGRALADEPSEINDLDRNTSCLRHSSSALTVGRPGLGEKAFWHPHFVLAELVCNLFFGGAIALARLLVRFYEVKNVMRPTIIAKPAATRIASRM